MLQRSRFSYKRKKKGSNSLVLLIGIIILITFFYEIATNAPQILIFLFCILLVVFGLWLWFRIRRHRRLLARLHTLGDFLALSSTQFEQAVGELLKSLGYSRMQHVGGSGDLMADLTCVTPQGQSAIVQCKRYASDHAVGSPDIQKFIGMMSVHHRVQTGLFVTTSSFTGPAQQLASQHGIQLIDGNQLAFYAIWIQQQKQRRR
ncbi:MAG: restriction endonuclease [Ktedonobacteraceae bacterium]